MAGFVSYNGIPCECGGCGAKVADNRAHMNVQWANQHGAAIRIFCDQCGQWTDRKMTKAGEAVRVFTPDIPHPTYVDRVFGIDEGCKHDNAFCLVEAHWCPDCNSAVGVTCPLRGGQGFMEENEMEGDWVNYGDELVTCRECSGKGWTSDPSFQ